MAVSLLILGLLPFNLVFPSHLLPYPPFSHSFHLPQLPLLTVSLLPFFTFPAPLLSNPYQVPTPIFNKEKFFPHDLFAHITSLSLILQVIGIFALLDALCLETLLLPCEQHQV